MHITATYLESLGACPEDVAWFGHYWPNGLRRVTAASVRKAWRLRLDVEWLVHRIGANDEYLRRRAPLLAEYNHQCDVIREEYEHQLRAISADARARDGLPWAELDRQGALFSVERARQWARAEYRRQCAPLVVHALATTRED